jgi:hypothetical protein
MVRKDTGRDGQIRDLGNCIGRRTEQLCLREVEMRFALQSVQEHRQIEVYKLHAVAKKLKDKKLGCVRRGGI